jgi:sensor histidine kinase YesM
MVKVSGLRQHPFIWLAQAAGLGAGIGLGVQLLMARSLAGGFRSAGVGVIFTLVIWGGFELMGDPMERLKLAWKPERVALAVVVWVLTSCLLLLGLSIGLVRLLFGVNLVHHSGNLAICILVGLMVSGFMATRATVTRQVEVERQLVRAEARAAFLGLQAQLQPHTLFNALNTIASLIQEDPAKAEEATERLAGLLRRVLGALERPEWPLREEFTLLEHLLRLEELRFGDRLRFRLRLDPDMAGQPVQPLLLLPLVENALKHGFRPKIGPCNLDIEAQGGTVRIQDDGVGRAADAPEGLGLRTVRERLTASGGSLRWLESAPGCTVEVRL